MVEDLRRSRLTVFFRLFLAIPHLLWLGIWSTGVFVVAVVAWFVVLIKGRLPDGLHRFFTMYIRYSTHVYAYLNLATGPFPGFLGENYEIDVEFDPPARQSRWRTGFRFFLAIPALLIGTVLGGSSVQSATSYGLGTGVVVACAFLTWFYALAKGRAPEGLTRLQWFCLHYGAQVSAYMLLVTDRYPSADPERLGVPWPAPAHPVALVSAPDDGRRSRLIVFFRLALAAPHFVWVTLWSVVAELVAVLSWFVTLFRGRSPAVFHRFLAAYVRYVVHVTAFATIVGAPFPGFTGKAGSYPVDVQIAPPARQGRWKTLFRVLLGFPALVIGSAIGYALWTVAFLGWFASLFTGRMPDGMRRLGLLSLRYTAQTNAYLLLLTDRYPYAGPPA